LAWHGKAGQGKAFQPRFQPEWTWLFFWLFVAGLGWAVFKEPDMDRMPGTVMVNIGLFGWVIVMIRRWLNT